eukprot:CAMPEP_0168520582 /NCGR_PEP_ID=MMETSP0405-20121227/8108_1 /TAXON_ID=498012 /ORGANISM="Trichosphaerium sp, Strain Am-I-7 wt" /LENGTH=233 /DNA_ID=CAMNT_0008541561 /DNA_START=81 /DNA_END=778 /DNA_ORIENTATION=+
MDVVDHVIKHGFLDDTMLEESLMIIGGLATATGEMFLPFRDRSHVFLLPLFDSKIPLVPTLVAATYGDIARALRETFGPIVPDIIKAALRCCETCSDSSPFLELIGDVMMASNAFMPFTDQIIDRIDVAWKDVQTQDLSKLEYDDMKLPVALCSLLTSTCHSTEIDVVKKLSEMIVNFCSKMIPVFDNVNSDDMGSFIGLLGDLASRCKPGPPPVEQELITLIEKYNNHPNHG